MTENFTEYFKAQGLAAFFRAQKDIREAYERCPLSAPFPADIVKDEPLLFNRLREEKRIERQKAVLDWVLAGDPNPDPEPISRRIACYLSYWGRRLRDSLRHQQD